jgi:hypothetical protein
MGTLQRAAKSVFLRGDKRTYGNLKRWIKNLLHFWGNRVRVVVELPVLLSFLLHSFEVLFRDAKVGAVLFVDFYFVVAYLREIFQMK